MTVLRSLFSAGVAYSAIACTQTTTESLAEEADAADTGVDTPSSTDAVTIGIDSGAEPDAVIADAPPDTADDVTIDAPPEEDTGPPDPNVCSQALPRVDDPWVPPTGDIVMRDTLTGSLWNARGEAFDGPCEGVLLSQLPSHNAFWFSWSISRDGHPIWNQDAPNSAGQIEPDPTGDCLVPCNEIRSGGPPPDGIPSLDVDGRWGRPAPAEMVAADHADAEYLADGDMVLGVYMDGEARAYPHNILWWHEIQVDRIGEREINATFCPLTGSGMIIDGMQGGQAWQAYVSGRLFNSNLTMFERDADDPTFWNQMLLRAVSGPRAGEALTILPVTETTWARWRELHPETLVTSDDTGYDRNYASYPYGDYRTDDLDTFMPTNPEPETTFENKDLVLSVQGPTVSKAYAFGDMSSFGARVVLNDAFDSLRVVVLFDQDHQFAVPFSRVLGSETLEFEGTSAP